MKKPNSPKLARPAVKLTSADLTQVRGGGGSFNYVKVEVQLSR